MIGYVCMLSGMSAGYIDSGVATINAPVLDEYDPTLSDNDILSGYTTVKDRKPTDGITGGVFAWNGQILRRP